MRMFAAASPDEPAPRTTVPAEILRRLAFGRPQRRAIQPAAAAAPAQSIPTVIAAPAPFEQAADLDQRVRQSGEW